MRFLLIDLHKHEQVAISYKEISELRMVVGL